MAAVGSSRMIRSGSPASANAKRARLASPPDSLLSFVDALSVRPATARSSPTGADRVYRRRASVTKSRTVVLGRNMSSCSIAPIRPSAIARAGVMPNNSTRPRSGGTSPSIRLIVVDLPAPFGPSSAIVSPLPIVRSIPRTASTCRKRRSTPTIRTAGGSVVMFTNVRRRHRVAAGSGCAEAAGQTSYRPAVPY